ncbi:TadE/TadG family type IV pilus assembly protein [Crystallibacter degradans]|uniref:TadE/TadG family type IV pilus assembly protein n=1 Tax=Crystallibacter degradans TaxID=2726743 RepID=UPI001475CB77|nr:TadE/TadG family type IV pilus assembly protein [Arthrobacter sp. SF27]NMR29402.1 pilus assembly protein [Arthrobacter sp. SF27]
MKSKSENGAAAVEFALVLPLLLLALLGVIEFGRAYNVQISLTQAAREGARYAAIHHDASDYDVAAYATESAPSLQGLAFTVSDGGVPCSALDSVEVTTSVSLSSMTGLLEAEFLGLGPLYPIQLEGKAVMRCGG